MQQFVRDAGAEVPSEPRTVEGLFGALPADTRNALANHVCVQVRNRVVARLGEKWTVAEALVDLHEEVICRAGDPEPWL
jgi:hypothetical protein